MKTYSNHLTLQCRVDVIIIAPMAAAPQPAPQPGFRPDYVPADGEPDPRVSSDERLWATGAHAVSFIEGGILGPLIIYLVKKEHSPFVAFHGLQSLYFGLAMMVLMLVTFITIIGPIAVAVAYWVYEIMACVKAYNGEWYRLPVVGNWAMKTHPIPAVWPPPGAYPQQGWAPQGYAQQPPPQQPPADQAPPQG
jgi:uncharacterized Tic20 family protein